MKLGGEGKINEIIVFSFFIILGVGYLIGYYFGRQDGIKKGRVKTEISLREESLQKGYCVLCKDNKNIQALQEKNRDI
ncbi:hypothetical protein [Acetohalobium arabaticum]|uniref:Uncharacterized protein n=1 Tax=Acetohalobium arabaticum (strain ATCC 49924 / DSM 5501 / Z-7288) TaxID=574087 RepID=D9QQ93_ACEAZ|nr:hypothetical protein [Acetohalobium arabaticum]ADL12684.1 hypothetical protein Acear_1162 [Acetohalobium arabaticum DSM 5501]